MSASANHTCPPEWTAAPRRRGLWLLVIVLLAGVTSLSLWRLSPVASGSAGTQGTEGLRFASDVSAGANAALPSTGFAREAEAASEASLAATNTLTHTYLLPRICTDYWSPADSAWGTQVYSNGMTEKELSRAGPMGAQWVRMPLNWSKIEPSNLTPEDYRWNATFGNGLARLSARGIQVNLTLIQNPSWAATYPQGPIDRADLSELVEFMVAVVEKYGQPPYNVKHWEFYNEPDNSAESLAVKGFGYFGHQPEAYARILEAVYQPMKAADPEAQIVFGGMAYDWWTSAGGPFVEEFLDGVLDHGGGDSFDVMNFHYYPAFRGNWEPYGPDIIGKATYLRNKLASYGIDKPLVCTEASMWSDETHGGSDELQSRYVVQLFARSAAADLQFTIWFMLRDMAGESVWEYGLVSNDFSLKPSYHAYSTFARQMAHASYVRTVPSTETGSDQIEAYEFARGQGPTRIVVAWTGDEQQHDMRLLADRVEVVDKFGLTQVTLHDGDDGSVDGQIRVTIGPSPVYLRFARIAG